MKKQKPDIIKKELQDAAPGLSKASKDNPFDVPGDYFTRLPETIQELKNSRAEKSHSRVFGLPAQRVLAYAATLAVLITFGVSLIFLTQKEDFNEFAGIDDEYMEAYFANLAEYDEAHYYELLSSEDLSHMSSEMSFEMMLLYDDDTEDDPYFEYLIDYMEFNQYLPADFAADENDF